MVSDNSTLLLIDGHSLAFRAFYALNPESFKTDAGQHTNAVHGFVSMLLNILEKQKPSHIAVAFDLGRESFRTEEYPEYKGTRGETPEEFLGQTEILADVLNAMGIKSITRENYEADDLIASLVEQGEQSDMDVLVVSGDRDTFQLISDRTTVLYPVKGVLNLARMTDEAVYEKYGVHANQYPDLAALVGETSDNLPGVPGVGPKTAAKWIQEYGSLDAILENRDAIGGKVGESLRENVDKAIRNRRLNRLVRELEFDFQVTELGSKSVDEQQITELFGKLQFKTLLTRVLKLRGTNGSQVSSFTELVETKPDNLELPEAQTLAGEELIQKLRGGNAAIDIEFSGTLVGFSAFNGDSYIWNGEQPQPILDYLSSDEPKIIWNSKLIERRLKLADYSLSGVVGDPLLSAYLLDPAARDYNIGELANEYLDYEIAEQTLLDTKNPAEQVWLVWQLNELLNTKLEKTAQLKVLNDIELPASKSLATMEVNGISLNQAQLDEFREELTNEVNEIAKEAFEIIGQEINLASPKQLQKVLFEDLGMKGTKAVKTGYSTNAEALATLYEQTEHPFLEKLLNHREVNKTKQIAETILQAVDDDGRIRTTYVQTGTSTGRLSSENPNLQNIPIKSKRGQRIRAAFTHGKEYEGLLTADYSQIEMRIMAHLSADESLIQAFKDGEDLHNYVGARIFDVEPDQVNPEMRSKVKAMSYGLVYGLSEYGLAKQLRMPNAEAKQLMTDYFARFGGVRDYLSTVVEKAKSLGFTVTEYGRRRPFPDLNSKIFQVRENARRAALNAPIQGTAADIMKIAMNQIHQQTEHLQSQMLLQVHDELVFEVYPGEREELTDTVTKVMSEAASLSVPLDVQIGFGANWDEAGH
ncbi:MAG: DNA polymerase I [Microbacteriaceae bacterium]|nr:DNA polymerase I [Microbacteriaceae bacterium]